jgi:hypothetical protein
MDVARDAYLIERLERLAPSDPFRLSVEEMQAEIIAMRAKLAERDTSAWLPLKQAAYRAGIGYEAMRMWTVRGYVDSDRDGDGGLISVSVASIDARLERLGRRPTINR